MRRKTMELFRVTIFPAVKMPPGSAIQPVRLELDKLEPTQLIPPEEGRADWTLEKCEVFLFGGMPMVWALWVLNVPRNDATE